MKLTGKFPTWPCFSEAEAEAVKQVLLSNKVNYWTGSEGKTFEEEFKTWVGCSYAIAVANGTVALELCLRGLGIGAGDEVIVTPRTFIASVSAVINVGATPVFADVSADNQCLSSKTIGAAMTENTKAVIVVHLAGIPADMDPILELADSSGIFVVEDCAQAHGATYKGSPVGSFGHVAAWSFCQDKIMTTGGEGGMVATNNKEVWRRMWSYKDHGKCYDKVHHDSHPPGFRWLHASFGSNFRMTEMQAAIGRIQLRKMEEWTRSRNLNAAFIDRVADRHPVVSYCQPSYEHRSAEYKHYLFVHPEYLKEDWTRDRIIEELNRRGVPCYQGSCSEVYREAAFDDMAARPKNGLEFARKLGETSLMFLVHPTLSADDMAQIASILDHVLTIASRRGMETNL